ncbi:unnamed protein product [Parnassius apollo]|uniref:(apollo) hypothetical protein n=1 Tax=Parnassius apollo TaxID=110799 RepID=A0A8S3XX17_PARAO|nr:unnamed protein product [Parnassius apollo]
MAESKGALIAKSVQKHAGRAKEKLLQNLGKVDRTLDDIFEEHLQNFNRQHQQATRLQKEFNNYIRCIRAVQTASKTLMEAITEVYESSWSGHDLLYVQAQNMEMLWQDFSHKLGDQVLIPLNTYTNQFPEVRKKIEKRGRKLVDYDGQRHSFQNLQANAAKRRDDVKVTKGREQLEEAKRTYEMLNSELHDELPALFDSRVLFYVNNLQTLFSAEQLFHAETAKVYAELEAITDKLATDSQRGSYRKPQAHNGNANTHNNVQPTDAAPALPSSPAPPARGSPPAPPSPALNGDGRAGSASPLGRADSPVDVPDSPSDSAPATPARSPNNNVEAKSPQHGTPVGSQPSTENINNNIDEKSETQLEKEKENEKDKEKEKKDVENQNKNDEVYDVPVGATLGGTGVVAGVGVRDGVGVTGGAGGTLYRVRATYRYTREDSDELSFDVGDIIRVVEYDDPDEQRRALTFDVGDIIRVVEYDDPDEQVRCPTHTTHTLTALHVRATYRYTREDSDELSPSTSATPSASLSTTTPTSRYTAPPTLHTPAHTLTALHVRATYRYTREDSDELSFDVGDIIRVVEYDDPDEQEEGWLMGIKESTNEKAGEALRLCKVIFNMDLQEIFIVVS